MNHLFFLTIACVISFGYSAQAHPGHDLMQHGGAHVISSAYHLAFLGAVTLLCSGLGFLVRTRTVKRALNGVAVAALLATVALWYFGQ